MTLSAWFDSLSIAGKIAAAFLIVLAAMGAAAGFVASIAQVARFAAHLFRGKRPPPGGPDGS